MTQDLLIRFVPVALVASILIGCNSSSPQVVPVSGKLTRKGQPVPNFEVNFVPSEGQPSIGMSDNQGQFKLNFAVKRDGAVVGTHTVFVTYNPPEDNTISSPSDLNDILAKYGSQEVSPLRINIAKAENDLEVKLD